MCIYKTKRENPKYKMNKKNGGIVPVCRDKRQLWTDTPCGKCMECKKKRAREWQVRLAEEMRDNKNAKVILLTFSTKSLRDIKNGIGLNGKPTSKKIEYTGYNLDNEICRRAVKLFRERWRKEYGKSPRYWLITELGQKGETEHVHMHGIIWEDERYKLKDTLLNEVDRIWKYGWIGRGKYDYKTGKYINYINEKTAGYLVKYVKKRDMVHKEYNQIVLTSQGMGKAFLESERAKDNRYRGKDTNQAYQTLNGGIMAMPEYYRRKMYTDEERANLSSMMLDKNTVIIGGKEYRKDIGDDRIHKMHIALREKNARLGYADGRRDDERRILEAARRRDENNGKIDRDIDDDEKRLLEAFDRRKEEHKRRMEIHKKRGL